MAERAAKKNGGIRCREAAPLMRAYIEDNIRDRDLRHLISHVRGCQNCYNELETSFMVDRTIRTLNSEEDPTYDLKLMLEKDLQEKETDVRRRGWMGTMHSWIVFGTVLLILLLLLDLTGVFRLGELI